MRLLVSWYDTYMTQLGSFYAPLVSCINGNYTFRYAPAVEALYRLEPVYNNELVKTGPACECTRVNAVGITVSSCNRCASPHEPCEVETYKQYEVERNIPGGCQLVFDYSKK